MRFAVASGRCEVLHPSRSKNFRPVSLIVYFSLMSALARGYARVVFLVIVLLHRAPPATRAKPQEASAYLANLDPLLKYGVSSSHAHEACHESRRNSRVHPTW